MWGKGWLVSRLSSPICRIDYSDGGADRYRGKPEYFETGCGMTRASTLRLTKQGVRVMEINAWGWDRPFRAIKEEFQRGGDKSILWGAPWPGSGDSGTVSAR